MRTKKEKTQVLGVKTVAAVLASASLLFCASGYAITNAQDVKNASKLFEPNKNAELPARALVLPTSAAGSQPKTAEQEKIEKLLASSTISDQAFSKTAKQLMPLTPDQIKTLHYLFNKTQQAVAASPSTPPKPVTTTLSVDLSPGATPPVIRLSSGLVTSLIFMDSTSAPWPIQWYDIGDPKRFNIKADPKNGSNTMMIQALTSYKSANIAVKLKGLSTPVMMTLLPGQKSVDYRVDLRVPGIGPNATAVGSNLPSTSSPQLLNVLNGVPPEHAKTLNVFGGRATAWEVGGKLYMRTRMTVISPGWLARMTSGDGTNAYEMPISPVVLALDNGATVSLRIKEQ